MNYTNLIGSWQADLPVQHTSNTELIRQKLHWCCVWQRATNLLFAPLAVRVQVGCSAFPFYTPTKPLIRLNYKYKTVSIPKLKLLFYILGIYKKM